MYNVPGNFTPVKGETKIKSTAHRVARKVSKITGFSTSQVEEVLLAAFRVFGDVLVEEGEFRIFRFMNIKLKIRPEHIRYRYGKTFDAITIPEIVYAKCTLAENVSKRLNDMYNDKDSVYREELREKLGPVYERAVRRERGMEKRARNKHDFRELTVKENVQMSGQILEKSLRAAMPNATEEEIQEALVIGINTLTPLEIESVGRSRAATIARYEERQKKYQEWLASYASPGHAKNKGRKKENEQKDSEG